MQQFIEKLILLGMTNEEAVNFLGEVRESLTKYN